MKAKRNLTYSQRLQRRCRLLYLVLVAMLAYMVLIGELGGGDSRKMTDLMYHVSRLLFFGGMGYVVWHIVRLRKLLRDARLRAAQALQERDERNRYLHEKSGGPLWDGLFLCQVVITCTAALFDRRAFYCALTTLVLCIVGKTATYLYWRRHS